MPSQYIKAFYVIAALVLLVSCSGGGSGSDDSSRNGGFEAADFDCDGSCANQSLLAEDVSRIISQGIAGAQLLGVNATFAVVDRVGNVLALYQMDGASATTTVNGQTGAAGGLEGLTVPSVLAAISKAGTGAYLSSQGNAFSTRTASQIIQEHFNPGELNQPGGPLFGVQFSQLPCGDVTVRNSDIADGRRTGFGKFSVGGSVGPRALPLGLSADPGGIPLYRAGDIVGGVGVEFDGVYRLDRFIGDFDDDPEERIAMQASRGFEAPSERVARNVNIGKSLRYTDLDYDDLEPLPQVLPAVDPARLVKVPDFSSGTIRAGVTFGDPSSGVGLTVRAGVPAAQLVFPDGSPRYPSRSGSSMGGLELSAKEVEALLDSVVVTAFRTRAAIRRPLDTPARVSIWIVDHAGTVLGMVRSQDAPVFGIDVALQKARSAVLFSSADAADVLNASGMGAYVERARAVLGPAALTGTHAFGDRSIGNMSRPLFPDGIDGTSNGPFSHPLPGITDSPVSWSPFNTGLQLDLAFGGLAQALGLIPSGDYPSSCTPGATGRRLANGLQIFAGAVPLYRNGVLIGGIGISGDGIDQDDLIAFYGASRRGLDFVGHVDVGDPALGFNAPIEIRADTILLSDDKLRLRYVNCPEAPFSGDNSQNVCDGL